MNESQNRLSGRQPLIERIGRGTKLTAASVAVGLMLMTSPKSQLSGGQYSSSAETEQTTESRNDVTETMLIGCWFKPHNAENTIIFKPDKTYNAQLWSDKENALLRYSGKYVALPDSVKLFFEDSLLYSFHFFRGNSGDDNYYLMSDNWYFVQSGSSDCK